ncbi:hypothetical protein [Arthrobacter sp. MA-N2]|uniref:hypothetical protein n=1 Tax=Arthrobacter sp. MA-N2 TaxID=1101188 RepID=UPI0012DC49DB|nr:hypothetical protein [Arthrobacter sp. MA-N2]
MGRLHEQLHRHGPAHRGHLRVIPLRRRDSARGVFGPDQFRQLDTRNGTGGVSGPVGPGQTISVKVTGRGGLPATAVSAVAMNITVANSTSSGVITAYAGGTAKPGTSNLNYTAGQIIPNFAITAVGADGTISFTNDFPGTVQLIADTMGYFNGPVTGGLPGPEKHWATPRTGNSPPPPAAATCRPTRTRPRPRYPAGANRRGRR